MSGEWPESLWLVRHGESVGNAASARAWAEGKEVIDVSERDADVDLTERGRTQAETLGRWLASLPRSEQPTDALVSPYLRARHTARIALEPLGGPGAVGWHVDERLRDRELGVLDRLTAKGIEARYPAEADARRRLGKFYHRPAGGESWADVALRLRGVLTSLRADHGGQRVVVFAHDIVVLLFRYLLEGLDEQGVLDIARHTAVLNCGVTHYDRDPGAGLVLRRYNAVIGADGRLEATSA
ncbi:histidine phosphatase family protein [Acidiferrimicrobium sp. IK]|uniref:histidine phosphatase family protein n=1 Tax=Acidiferrimicrobium sp. IK TaxID=2871700 RepID=UPI0021CB3879|nr:histidine phosphatase family protein [Acidiferrimicrobium sp. IK]MCU4183319.1 histidine phosphatase family protein [Acidiferrimicrobium sp. IK]